MKSFRVLVVMMLLQVLGIMNLSAEKLEVNLDKTAAVGVDVASWNAGGWCDTQYAPAITTSDGRNAQMVEKYESTVETVGTILSQTITGLENGTYTVVLYANAFFTPGRGFESTLTNGATDVVYVFANDKTTPVVAAIATETTTNSEYTLAEVEVTDGTLTMGLAKSQSGSNWHTIQIKSLTLNATNFLLPYGQNTQRPWEAKYFKAMADEGTVPVENWYTTDFDDTSWDTIAGPISNNFGYYYATAWDDASGNTTYWVRRHFTLESIETGVRYYLYTLHDDECQIYLNGQLIYENGGVMSSTQTTILTDEQVAYLKEGDNLLAVKVSNSGGGDGYMDFGLEPFTESVEGGIRYRGTVAYELTDNSLSEYIIKEGTTAINSNLFYYNNNVTSITLPNSLVTIGDNAFYYCQNLTNINMPDSVVKIGAYAFYRCGNLVNINIPKCVQIIGDYAFRYCTALDSVSFNAANCTSVPNNVFDYCSNLRAVAFGDDVKSIPANLFYDDNLQSVTIGSNVEKIGDYAFYTCNNLTTINIPNSVDHIGNQAFYDCSSLPIEDNIRYADCYAIELTDKSQSTYTLKENTRFLGSELFRDCYYMTSLVIPSGITAIGNNAFRECNALSALTLPDGVKYIGDYAFYSCDALSSINIPSEVSSIGNFAFYDCSLKSLTLPDGLTSIGEYAFYSCDALTSINIPSGVTSIGNRTFYDCYSLKSLTLPDGLTSIGESAFCNCGALTSINIPSGVTSIKNYTFYECSSLQSLTLPEGLTRLGEQAFYSCDALTSINIPSGVSSIPNNTFQYCYSLRELDLSEGLTSIGEYAFYDCNSLLSVKIPSGVTYIGNYAFNDCDRIRDFEIPSTIETIGYSNFDPENLIITSHATTPPTIQGGCYGKLIFVPAGSGDAYRELYPDNTIVDGDGTRVEVEVLEEGMLGEQVLRLIDYMYNINHLVVSGSINDTDIDCIKNSMTSLVSVDFSGLNMEVVPNSLFYNNRTLTKVILPNNTTEIGSEAFRFCKRLKEVALPETLTKIGSYAFNDSGLDTIALPANVVEINNNAFESCYHLKSINIPLGMKRLENNVFSGCYSLQAIELPDSLTYIGSSAFYGCSSLASVTLSDALTQIAGSAFYGCSSLASITFPSHLTSIGYQTFRDCYALESIEFPASLVSMDSYAFYNCNQLQTVTFHGGTSIGEYAFADSENLEEVILPATLNRIGNYVFNGCGQLKSITSKALFPPTTEVVVPNDQCILYAPEWTYEKYKLAGGWSAFNIVEPISDVYPELISISNEQSLTIPDGGLPDGYKPYMSLASQYIDYWNQQAGKLTVRGERPLTLSTFEMQQTRDVNTMTTLLNKGAMSADSVVTKLSFQAHRWHFLSFPYDVKVSDIVTQGDWVVRYYDGEARAQGDIGATWKNVPYDSILHAGVGYIWHSTDGNFEVPAVNNDNKNRLFSNETLYQNLQTNISSTAANNGWNLIGNPYPTYFDTRLLEFSSPITVRIDEYSYAAYSPLDDSYILSPLEAFFVQCSADNNLIGFSAEGRQTSNEVRAALAPRRTRVVNSNRSVYNLYLENAEFADHTRFVINEDASLDYEMTCDASKFMSDNPKVSQLFTIEQGEPLAINERPLSNGEIALGVYIGKAGSYTISLDTRATDYEVVLVDHFTGIETDIAASDYTFTAEAGTYSNRFSIRMKGGVVDVIENTSNAAVKVTAAKGIISVSNATSPVQVYTTAGALVATKNGNAVTFEVTPGVYVIKTGADVYKVSVVE